MADDIPVEHGQIVEGLGDVGVVGAERCLADRKGTRLRGRSRRRTVGLPGHTGGRTRSGERGLAQTLDHALEIRRVRVGQDPPPVLQRVPGIEPPARASPPRPSWPYQAESSTRLMSMAGPTFIPLGSPESAGPIRALRSTATTDTLGPSGRNKPATVP